ncbi:MAG: recombinase family protein [Bdellovibrionaceae bacterium]|nr:recombinase family protein [Pseudobdellovibrionaceae bacterium]MBX3034787.1 recombinase family protein [Pseudobdellovibrionaceae bacterium]
MSSVDNRNEAWGEIVEWYVDKDYSGKDTNRPGFQKMMGDIAAGRINAVIVTELSRLSRSVKDFCDLYEFLKLHKITFFSLRENFDTSTPAGELMIMQSIAFAQFERHSIVDRIRKGARARAERGLGHGYVALGFKLVEHRPNHREIDPKEKPYVQLIFDKMLELKRLSKVVDFLNGEGLKTKEFITKDGKKRGGNRWTRGSLHSRKLRSSGNQHLHRCKVENVPAVQVEEAVVGRLKELAKDKLLIEELARESAKLSLRSTKSNSDMLELRESEAVKLRTKVHNLVEAIEDESDKVARKGLTARLSNLQVQLEQCEGYILKAREELNRNSNVVDVKSVFSLLKAFRSEFDKIDISMQAEVLKDIVAEIEVHPDGIQVKYIGLGSGNTKGPASSRSFVRSVSKLVDLDGIEPTTSNMPC